MPVYLCSVLCTECGEIYDNLIDKNFLTGGVKQISGSMESINYRCDRTHKIVRIRRFFKDVDFSEELHEDKKVNVCPACLREVLSFGDRYHVELGGLSDVLRQPCPKCNKKELVILEKVEVK